MTAFSGGGRPNGHPNPLSARSDLPVEGGPAQPRPLDQIFPLRGDANRGREMQSTWRSFCRDRLEAVRGVLATGRSPPEIAYQLGELLHNHFRTRGVTLTSYELRRLVAELLALHGPAEEGHEPPPAEPRPAPPTEPHPPKAQPVVAFDGEPPKMPWPGDVPAAPRAPRVSDTALEPPPSPIVTVTPREPTPRESVAPLERLLARAMDLAKGRLATDPPVAHAAADVPARPVASEPPAPPLPPPEPPAEEAKPNPIDRLWSDRAVKAIFVNGPHQVFVEREGALQAVDEGFDDEAQLIDWLTRLAGRPENGVAGFALPDGSAGVAIFPPAAPAGPVLTVRRAEPGQATLDGLVTKGLLDRPTAKLLRLCARGRLNMLVSGPRGSGKTALLAALIRDLDPAQRVVTVAGHREFRWPMASKVELVASAEVPFATLISAAARLEPGLLVLDGVQLADVAALSERLLRGAPGTLATIEPEVMSAALARSAELVVRIDGVDGTFRVVAVEDAAGVPAFAGRAPAFAATLQARGLGESLAKLFA
ncbi:MAG: Flp pilus assembly complex ATPase component TadA [Reyranella sp.]|uniref:ATPase, T2SS/T4P/T4SS family n=1 Tax=Reyranella sp. TaxID=1929291 RepID=UPI001AD2CD92|nr:ATPase, T2SS/T4P/T4SS family [Reyranella sp.]MBN9088195.1 Flp pilus assembly complex ATPase component TadA [Reyranella sp.]